MENWNKNISGSSVGVTMENPSEMGSEEFSSDLTASSNSSSRLANHHRYCNVFINQECTCEFVIEVEKRHIRRQMEKTLQISHNSHQSAILAGHLNVSSQQSSDASYHSAQGVCPTPGDRSSIETCASASDMLNQEINSAYESSSATEAAADLNKVQNLFKVELDVPENEKECLSNTKADCSSDGSKKYTNLQQLLRRISIGTLEHTNESETSQEILLNLSRTYAQDPENFTRRLVTIMEETEFSNTLKQILEKYDSEMNVANTSMPTAMDETVTTPPDMILRRDENNTVIKTPKTPMKRSRVNTPINDIVKNTGKSPLKQSPGIFASIKTPGSMRSHNDSSFTALEKACGITTPSKFYSYSPDLKAKEKLEKIVAEQEKRLAVESPIKKCNQIIISPATPKSIRQDSLHTDGFSDVPTSDSEGEEEMANLSASIMEEVEKKLQRCFETHRTIQEIDAESSEASALEETKSSGMTSFLNLLTHVPNYQRYLKSDEIRAAARDREDSGVDIRPTSSLSRRSKCRDLLKSPMDPKSLEIKVKLNLGNVTVRKPTTNSKINRSKSPTIRTSLEAVKVKSAYRRGPLNTLTPRSRLSPAKSTVCPASRAVSPELLSRQRKCSTPRTPHVKIPGYKTPQSRSRPPMVTPRKTPRPASSTIPKITFTEASALRQPGKHSEFDLKSLNTPKTKPRVAKYFPTPGRTPLQKVHTPKVFFPTDTGPSSTSSSAQSGLHEWYGLSRVKSPVAAYIHSTDSTLVTKMRSKTNDRLLTPKMSTKNSAKSTETLHFNLAKQGAVGSRRVINDENASDNVNRCHIPQVRYELPSEVKEISEESSKIRGVRTQGLLQNGADRQVIRHEGRSKPLITNSMNPDFSIHVVKSAEKQKFIMRHKK